MQHEVCLRMFPCILCPEDLNVDTKANQVQTSNPILTEQPDITFYDSL